MSNYIRIVPRDFFNESKLLKCMGQLYLKNLDCQFPPDFQVEIEESGEPFEIQLTDDGRLFVSNYTVIINGRNLNFSTIYNSQDDYPMVCIYDGERIVVFDDNGNFTFEFYNLCIE